MNSFFSFKNFHVRVNSVNSSLAFFQLNGIERLSGLFAFEIELLSTNFYIDVKELLGTELTVEIETAGLGNRYLNGVVTDFELLGRQQATSEYYLYKATVRPSLWYLTQGQDYRIF
ncbi:MAG: contractile injection system protein, VgrG/Pvc8 family, partial [Alcaligenaceae bacterium]|nr:contractile injection system protein, VgrG/Pvc8 family [Alcaligenaceae bacterium]